VTEAERYIADVWRDVLNIDDIGRYDYFFEIGGHSLPAAQMVARIENEKGIRIPLREVILTNLGEVAMTHLNLQDEQPLISGIVKRLIGKHPLAKRWRSE
jgi:acyl carrier protein